MCEGSSVDRDRECATNAREHSTRFYSFQALAEVSGLDAAMQPVLETGCDSSFAPGLFSSVAFTLPRRGGERKTSVLLASGS